MSTPPGEATADPSTHLEEARNHAENGDLDRAAELFRRVLETGDTAERAQAALGLAVVLEGRGDHEGAREADRLAIATEDPEYGARAAYHLALSWERAGGRDQARDAWRTLVDFGNRAYLPPAYLALAQIADEEGDTRRACEWWEQAIATGDEEYAPVAAHDLALRLIDWGEPARAQRVLAGALDLVDRNRDPQAHARLAVSLGIAHLEQAINAFGSVTPGEDADPEVVPLAIELLARTLPLRGRDEAAQEIWRRGLDDPALGEDVRARLRRTFAADGEDVWWEDEVEAAVRANSLPLLTSEAFGALDHIYALIATRYTKGGEGLSAEAYDVLGEAVRVPADYPWGRALQESFAERLRQAMGSDVPVLPPNWPDAD
ncbi:tetratricopeptide repeat protein [Actinoallomurus purpureus]|uniref:tetratricopeptide repeat protein n=1 Tax=Actinoallomurus purpureus TaxID=478114 RepID=UPI002092ED41|nr:tetratricopeptide repeat protein [Actinoallomurus purpureus]MCO6003738.1 tetratricopeptide repeat protein [Actinoallomurus purpureus]